VPASRQKCNSRAAPPYNWRVAEKEEKIELEGEVVEAFPNGLFKIMLDNGHETLGYTAGKMRRYRIRVYPGDRVKIELSPYDLGRGRIVYRYS
jgi:translation initiation factor IF-1